MITSTPVLVLITEHHGALGVMRSLGRLGVPVYGLHADARAPALASRYCRGAFLWDLLAAPARASINFLLGIANRLGSRPVLLATNDESALFVAEHAEMLEPAFRFPKNSLELVRGLYDKRQMNLLATKLGIPTAETVFPRSRDEVVEFARAGSTRFPVMLKASDNIVVSRRTGKKMVITRSPDDLIALYDAMEDAANPTLMLQEYIAGGDDSVWMFNGYFDEHSDCLFGLTGRKIHQTPVYTGMTALGVCLPNSIVHDLTLKLVKETGYRGILDIGYRFDARTGTYKLLDANPRLGATFRLFVGEDGMDVVRAAYLHLTGQAVPLSQMQTGRKWIVEDADLISSAQYLRDGVLGVRQWLTSYAGVREAAWYASDDLRPFFRVGRKFCVRPFRHVWRRLRAAKRTARHAVSAGDTGHPARPGAVPEQRPQDRVNAYFQSTAPYWSEIYQTQRLRSRIYQHRHAMALDWIAGLRLSSSARILEVGCGAGELTAALARMGHRVNAIDPAPAMIDLAREKVLRAGVASRVELASGDAHALPFADSTFDLVVALGVLPWLHSESVALAEMQRVLKPGGHLLLTADNERSLGRMLDPASTPLLARPRRLAKGALAALGRPAPAPEAQLAKRHAPAALDRMLDDCRLIKLRSHALGFGPLTFGGTAWLPDPVSLAIHRKLQGLADQGRTPLSLAGAQVVVLAKRPGSPVLGTARHAS